MLIRIGYLTKERCRSFRQWRVEERKSAIATAVSATNLAKGIGGEIGGLFRSKEEQGPTVDEEGATG